MMDGTRFALEEYLKSGNGYFSDFLGIKPLGEQELEHEIDYWVLHIISEIVVPVHLCGRKYTGLFSERRDYYLLNVKEFPSFLLRGEGELGEVYEHGDDRNEPKPFSERQMEYIEILCIAGGLLRAGRIPGEFLISRKALQQGIHTAIITNNPRNLSLLLLLDESIHESRVAFLPIDRTLEEYTIPDEYFRMAVRVCRSRSRSSDHDQQQSGIPSDLLRILIRASSASLPSDDPLVVQFAIDVGGVFGKWLLDLMVDNNHNYSSKYWRLCNLFRRGEPCMDKPLARRYAEEVMDDEDEYAGQLFWYYWGDPEFYSWPYH